MMVVMMMISDYDDCGVTAMLIMMMIIATVNNIYDNDVNDAEYTQYVPSSFPRYCLLLLPTL